MKELVSRCSTWKKLVRVVARMLRWFCKTKFGLRAKEMRSAKTKLIKFVQKDLVVELKKALESLGKAGIESLLL